MSLKREMKKIEIVFITKYNFMKQRKFDIYAIGFPHTWWEKILYAIAVFIIMGMIIIIAGGGFWIIDKLSTYFHGR